MRSQPAPPDAARGVGVPTLRHAAGSLASVAALAADPGSRFAAEEAAFMARVGEPDVAPAAGPATPALVPAAIAPPPDRSRLIGGAVAAVIRSGAAPELILREDGGGFRRLASGGVYRDGWRLKGVSGQTIVLARGGEERVVPIRYGPPDPADAALSPPSSPVTIARAGPPAGGMTGAAPASDDGSAGARPRRLIRRPGRS